MYPKAQGLSRKTPHCLAHPPALTNRVAEEVHHGVGEAISAANAHHHRAGDVVHGHEVSPRLQRVAGGQLLYVVWVDISALPDEPLPDVFSAVFRRYSSAGGSQVASQEAWRRQVFSMDVSNCQRKARARETGEVYRDRKTCREDGRLPDPATEAQCNYRWLPNRTTISWLWSTRTTARVHQ